MTLHKLSSDPNDVSTLDVLIPTLGFRYAWLIFKFGYKTLYDVQKTTAKDILSIPGIGKTRASLILEATKTEGQISDPLNNVIYLNYQQLDLFNSC